MGPLIGIVVLLGVAGVCFALSRRLSRELETERGKLAVAKAAYESGASSAYSREQQRINISKAQGEINAGTWVRRALIAGAVAALGGIVAMSIVVTPTRNVAVTTAFGRPTGTLSNGLSVIFPWESTTNYDATVQTLEMNGDDKDGRPRQNVRIIGGTATAGMDVVVEWRIDPKVDITQLHQDWRNFESLEARVIKPRLAASLNAVFEKFDPLVAQREQGATPVSLGSKEPELRDELQRALPKEIVVRSVMIAFVQYPPNVQKALDDMQVELANTQIALQQQQTAEAQKAAIETLASAKMSPDAIVQYCLVVTERLAQAGKAISAAWNCMGTVPVTVGVTK